MQLYSDYNFLNDNLAALGSRIRAKQDEAVKEICNHVEAAARELSLLRFANFENELYQNIFLFVVSGGNICEKIGGILAMLELIDCTSAAAEQKVVTFANTLSNALKANTEFEIIELVAEALGQMAKSSSVSQVDYVENELNQALNWLREPNNQSYRRFSACVVLQQLAENAPTIFFVRTKEFFDLIWRPLWDPKEKIRLSAGAALSACLAVLRQRTYHLQWYCNIYDQIHQGFDKGSEETVHGSLIVVSEMLKHTGDFMIPRFKEISKAIISLKNHRSKAVRVTILQLLPHLASFCPDAFARTHLDESVEILVKCGQTAELREQALLSTGRLCMAVGSHLKQTRVDELLAIVRDSLVVSVKKNRSEVATEALKCVSDMVQGLGDPFHEHALSLLEPMLASGLTSELIDTLSVIATYMPAQRPAVQQRLLEEATKILGGEARPRLPVPSYLYSWGRKGQRYSLDSKYTIAIGADQVLDNSPLLDLTMNAKGGTGPSQKSPRNEGHSEGESSVSISKSSRSGSWLSSDGEEDDSTEGGGGSLSPTEKQRNSISSSIKKGLNFFRLRGGSLSSTTPHQSSFSASNGIGGAMTQGPVRKKPSKGVEPPGAPRGINQYALPRSKQNIITVVARNPELVLLSLITLGSLALPENSVMMLVEQSVLPYVASNNTEIRREAATTCARMIAGMTAPLKCRGPTAIAIEKALSQLIHVMVSDPESTVRLSILQCFHADFDRHLARSHHIEALLFLLSDENNEIKLQTLNLLGRLAMANPAAVLPPLRLLLMRLISEIKNSGDNKQKEEATLLLCTFLRSSSLQSLIHPFIGVLISSLPLGVNKKSSDVRLMTAGLEALGELCKVMEVNVLPFADQLLPIIIANMCDYGTMKKQEMATRTLGQLVNATGQVVTPYLQYPDLLPTALSLNFTSSTNLPWTLRRELLRTLGLLGALEPHKYIKIITYLQQREARQKALLAGDTTATDKVTGNLGWRGPGSVTADTTAAHSPGLDSVLKNLRAAATTEEGGDSSKDVEKDGKGKRVELSDNRKALSSVMVTDELLDDERAAERPAHYFMYEQSAMRSLSEPLVQEAQRPNPSDQDYYPQVAVTVLMKILKDKSQSIHHSSVTQAILLIFKSLGMACVPMMDEIVPYLLELIRHCNPGLRESLLQQLAQLASIVQYHLIPYLPQLFEIIIDYWYEHLEHILALVEEVSATASDAFGGYVTTVLPLLLSSLAVPKGVTVETMKILSTGNSAPGYSAAQAALKPLEKTLSCHDSLRITLRPHMHLVVPAFCKLIQQLQDLGPETEQWQISAVKTLRRICSGSRGAVVEQSNIMTTRVIHTLTQVVIVAHKAKIPPSSQLYQECIVTLCRVGRQLGSRLSVFDQLIRRSIEGKGLNTQQYIRLSNELNRGSLLDFTFADREHHSDQQLLRNEESESDLVGIARNNSSMTERVSGLPGATSREQKLIVNQGQLARSWDVSQRSTAVDWNEWLKRLKLDLLRESSSPALRACAALAQAHPPLANDLFHAAFVSCWNELSEQYQDSLVRALQSAFRSTTIPPEILQILLNLAEFMEHDVEPLPISLSILAELAQKGHAYAKALHYREMEFQTSPATCFESLININKKLDQYDAAMGVLRVVDKLQKKHPELSEAYKVQEAWLAKLGHWDAALMRYEQRLQKNSTDGAAITGKLKCLDALGRWEEAIQMCLGTLDQLRIADSMHNHPVMTPSPSTLSLLDATDSLEDRGKLSQKKSLLSAPTSPSSRAATDEHSKGSQHHSSYAKSNHTKAAVIGARAAWSLNEWNLMDTFLSELSSDNIDACFMRAVLAVHHEDYEKSKEYIDVTRKHLDSSIRTLLTESYGRAYVPLIMVQQCSELEEITEYKTMLRNSGLNTTTNDDVTRNRKLPLRVKDSGSEEERGGGGHTSSLLSQGMAQYTNGISTASAPPLSDFSAVKPTELKLAVQSQGAKLPTRTSMRCGQSSIYSMSMEPMSVGGANGEGASSSSIHHTLQQEAHKRKGLLAEKWRKRIRGCAGSGRAAIPVWKYLLNGRRMVLNEREDFETWLEFATLCRHGGNNALAERVLNMSWKMLSSTPNGAVGAAETPPFSSSSSSSSRVAEGIDILPNMANLRAALSKLPEEEKSRTLRMHFAMLKQHWVSPAKRSQALSGLESLIRHISDFATPADKTTHLDCLLKLGEWKIAMIEPGMVVDKSTRRDVLALYGRAITVDPTDYRAWHQWGLSNYRAIEESRMGATVGNAQAKFAQEAIPAGVPLPMLHTPTKDGDDATAAGKGSNHLPHMSKTRRNSNQIVPSLMSVPQEILVPLAVNATKGLMKAIALGTQRWSSSVTQDMLCVLGIWFRFGRISDVLVALEQGLEQVHLDNWLGVLPQLLARIDHPEASTRGLLHSLLMRMGEKHAQALVYPLGVALKSPRGDRKEAAEKMMQSLRKTSTTLVDQALMVSQELVRVAILWQEEWHETLEEASRQYFGDGNVQAMLETLAPLHAVLESGPNTMREASFCNAYANDLNEAWANIKKYKDHMREQSSNIPTSGAAPARRDNTKNSQVPSTEETMLHHAWDLYYNVFKRINATLPHITSLKLQFCSPALTQARDLDIGVPGTYRVDGSSVRIRNFSQTVAIIRSKQRPRKIKCVGEDGREFVFLLKGHEDLRQDERAMQLFGLVNALLYHDRRTGSESHDLSIQRYAVLPLSPTAGLISWVPNCDTLHDLVRDYRESKKTLLNTEHKLMQQVAPNQTYEALPFAHKLEVFEYALSQTPGDDLMRILWLKSETSEVWLERRATYTRSLAVMSMVGYVLGLGDRHPSNLMLDRKSGKVLHIDFGDCFEVAMQREKFPERVPFRLTRMLVKAMEVSGIEGNYRRTCEKVMSVLRENRDSLVATLEAFVHDPLISWRLLTTGGDKKKAKRNPEANRDKSSTRKTSSGQRSTSDGGSNSSHLAGQREATKKMTPVIKHVERADVLSGQKEVDLSGSSPEEKGNAQLGLMLPAPPATNTNSNAGLEVNAEMPSSPMPASVEGMNKGIILNNALAPLNDYASTASTTADQATATNKVKDLSPASDTNVSPRINDGSPRAEMPDVFRGRRLSKSGGAVPLLEPIERSDVDVEAEEGEGSPIPSGNADRASLSTVSSITTTDTPAKESDEKINHVTQQPQAPEKSCANAEVKCGAGEDTAGKSASDLANSIVNLHVAMSTLANSSANTKYGPSHSFSRRSLRGLMSAQARASGTSSSSQVTHLDHTVDSESDMLLDTQEELTEKAVQVIRRVMDKLTGLDFVDHSSKVEVASQHIAALDVEEQVDKLICQAMANENLCLSYFGWCPFW